MLLCTTPHHRLLTYSSHVHHGSHSPFTSSRPFSLLHTARVQVRAQCAQCPRRPRRPNGGLSRAHPGRGGASRRPGPGAPYGFYACSGVCVLCLPSVVCHTQAHVLAFFRAHRGFSPPASGCVQEFCLSSRVACRTANRHIFLFFSLSPWHTVPLTLESPLPSPPLASIIGVTGAAEADARRAAVPAHPAVAARAGRQDHGHALGDGQLGASPPSRVPRGPQPEGGCHTCLVSSCAMYFVVSTFAAIARDVSCSLLSRTPFSFLHESCVACLCTFCFCCNVRNLSIIPLFCCCRLRLVLESMCAVVCYILTAWGFVANRPLCSLL